MTWGGGPWQSFTVSKNDSSGDFQHSKQFKLKELYLSKYSKVHKRKQTSFLAKVNSTCFFPISGRHVGVSILSSLNLCGTFWQITRARNTAQIWDLDWFLIYVLSITCQFLDFIHWTVSIFFVIAWQWKPRIRQHIRIWWSLCEA